MGGWVGGWVCIYRDVVYYRCGVSVLMCMYWTTVETSQTLLPLQPIAALKHFRLAMIDGDVMMM